MFSKASLGKMSSSVPPEGPSAKGQAKIATPCCSKVGLKRGPWTLEEDELLSQFIQREGEGKWRTLPTRAGLLRCGKSCRLRWLNYLHPAVKRGQIAADEEDLILRLHRLLGNRWSLIAGRIPGRTDNEIKNYWNTHLSKKLISQGIDPRTHKPLKELPSSPPPIKRIKTAADVSREQIQVQHENFEVNYNPKMMTWNNENDGMNNGCSDDVFYSFLNSLINEDPFVGLPLVPSDDPLVSSFCKESAKE